MESFAQVFALDKAFKLNNIAKKKGEDFIEGLLELWLEDLGNFFYANTPEKKLSEAQQENLAEMLYGTYGFASLNLGDLKIIFEGIKKGRFGRIYGTLNPPQIMGFVQHYLDERQEEAAQFNLNKHKSPSLLDRTPRTSESRTNKSLMQELSFNYEKELAKARQKEIKR